MLDAAVWPHAFWYSFACTLILELAEGSGPHAGISSQPVEVIQRRPHSNGTSAPPMLQLMSLSLDNWGDMHREAKPGVERLEMQSKVHRKLPDLALVEVPERPLLALMSLNLDNWGANCTLNCSSGPLSDKVVSSGLDETVNPLARVLPSESNLFDPRGLHTHSISLLLAPTNKIPIVSLCVLMLILLISGLLLWYLCCDGSSSDDQRFSEPVNEDQQNFATVDSVELDGSWAQVYREAQGEEKEALELLFRCNIISTEEFANSIVSHDHMEECLWIATHMLRQKPLEEWVALWQQAQQTFEDSVTAVFEARSGPHSGSHSQGSLHLHHARAVSNLSLGAVPLSGRSVGSNRSDEEDLYASRSQSSVGARSQSSSPNVPSMGGRSQPSSPNAPQMLPNEQDRGPHGLRIPGSANTVESVQSRHSIDSELDRGLALHGFK